MRSAYSMLMQSKFFNPAFNSAIFDGPVRIYFSQFHESLALKVYFNLQQKFPELMNRAKGLHQVNGKNILVMIYPSQESFQMSFEGLDTFLVHDKLENDSLIGINGPFEDDRIPEVLHAVADSIALLENKAPIFSEAQI